MKISEASKRYAKALLSLAKQKDKTHVYLAQLERVNELFHNNIDVVEFLSNPIITNENKLAVVKSAFSNKGLEVDVENAIYLLVENGRAAQFSEFVSAFTNEIDAEDGVTRGIVRSAKPLSADYKKELEQRIAQLLKKKIILDYQEDSQLLGGVVATVGGWTFDDSVDTHLKKLNEELNRRAN